LPRSAKSYGAEHFPEDAALDRTIRERRALPPPSVGAHRPRGAGESGRDFGEIRVTEVVTEDETAGADPGKREPGRAQVVLEHPVVAARLEVQRREN